MAKKHKVIFWIFVCIVGYLLYIAINAAIFFIVIGDDPSYISYDSYDHIPDEVTGRHADEVEAEYGQSTTYGKKLFPRWDRVYNLGPEPGLFGLDSGWLLIRIDSESVVYEADVGCD